MIHTLLTFVGVHNLRIHFALLGTKRAKDGLLQRLVESLFVWPARFSVWLVLGLELASKSLRVLFGFWRSSRRLRSVSATWALSCLSLFFGRLSGLAVVVLVGLSFKSCAQFALSGWGGRFQGLCAVDRSVVATARQGKGF